jgi:hypothetical protein
VTGEQAYAESEDRQFSVHCFFPWILWWARPQTGRLARAGYTQVETGEMSGYSPDMADPLQLRFHAIFSWGMICTRNRERCHDPGRRMPVRRGAVQGGG